MSACTCTITQTRIQGLPAIIVTPDPECTDESHQP
jgi:hypothetical protein